jgi:hypothetical protein
VLVTIMLMMIPAVGKCVRNIVVCGLEARQLLTAMGRTGAVVLASMLHKCFLPQTSK